VGVILNQLFSTLVFAYLGAWVGSLTRNILYIYEYQCLFTNRHITAAVASTSPE